MPRLGLQALARNCGRGSLVVTLTVSSSTASTFSTPSRLKAGAPATLSRRFHEKATSAAVTGLPEANLASLRRWKVNSVHSGLTSHFSARRGTIVLMSSGRMSSSVS